MKKIDSNHSEETPEQKIKRLEKENAKLKAKLKSQKETDKAKIAEIRKELKKKDVRKVTLTDEQMKSLSNLFPDIDILFK